MNKSDTHKAALARFESAWEYDRVNREAGRDDLENIAGNQWPESERQAREDDGRPCLTMNRLPQAIRQVTGDLRQNRPSIQVRPAGEDAADEVAQIYAGIIRNIEARSRIKKPYITAGIQAASCGIGHFRVLTDYAHSETFEQDIFLEPIHNPFAVVWDPLSRDATRADARYCFVVELMAKEDFEKQYPKAKISSFEKGESKTSGTSWFDKDTVRVAEYWEKVPYTRKLARLPDGRIIKLDDLEDEEVDYIEAIALEIREIETHKVQQWTISGFEVLDGPTEWLTSDIPIVAVTGEEIVSDDKVTRVSIVRHAKDAQRMYNYWNTANTEFVALAPKQPYIAAIDQIAPFAKDWQEANKANKPVLPYKPVPNAPPPQRQAPPMPSSGMVQAMQSAAEDIKATTGIYDAAMGNRSNETSGRAIMARQRESDVSTYFIADNLSAAVQQCGRILVTLIPRIYDTARRVRILHEDGSEEFQPINQPNDDMDGPELLNDLSVGAYDVDVSTGPSYTTLRAEASESLMQFGQAYPHVAPMIADLVAKNMDWPGAAEIADRLRKTLPPGMAEGADEEKSPEELQAAQARQQQQEQGQKVQEAQVMLALKEMEAKVAKLESETEENRIDTATKKMELAASSGQIEQMVRAQVAAEISAILSQQSVAPAPGFGV